ncbi:SKIP-like spliceosomal component [Aureococcus anophagefferens]|uniref:SKIP-like spliceosomal component n=1 Tax=Aureococcus anophagefferens TaxID=44056 RepID=A0ABR1FYK5_AURAN
MSSVAPGQALSRALPTPAREYVVWKDEDKRKKSAPGTARTMAKIPGYGSRRGFVPRSLGDFGDGGAYPEVHVAQYPLGMGTKEEARSSSTAVVALEVGEDGAVKYDAIVKQGENKGRLVQTSLADVKEKAGEADALALPSAEAEAAAAQRTQAALGAILDGKINSAKPTHVPEACDPNRQKATFVRYTPNPSAPGYSASASQRIVKLVDQQVDPMAPPKHKHTKIPRGPPSPPVPVPVPVLHSPPRKVTVHDQQSWKIPPCVSNWKNARGYTIPLDKRLAADGRGLQEQTVNNDFATLAEALYIAERSARDDMRLDNAKGDMKRSRLERERDRDVSEKVALGLLKGTAKLAGEAQFDKRLFNQSSGMDSGFGDDGDYNVYSKPLLDREDATAIYRPREADAGKYGDGDAQLADLTASSKFAAPERGFAGTAGAGPRSRDKPVQFEAQKEEADPFGLDAFLTDVKNKQ